MVVRGLYFSTIVFIFITFGFLYGTVPQEYLLPSNHPIKPSLDYLFSQSRALLNLENLEKAGFEYSPPRKFTNLIVAKHPALPGYIFKLYLDAQRFHKDKPEHHFWILRVQGSILVRQQIAAARLDSFLKVPQKWIYKLPSKPAPALGYMRKSYILVEEDMDLVSKEHNEALWSSSFVSKELLNAVYQILTIVGLSDCAKPDNIPFSTDGRIAFIDTQTFGRKVPYKNLEKWLSEENKIYWKVLTDQ